MLLADRFHQISRWTWVALILPLIAISPLLYMQCGMLMQKPHLQFFPLAIVAAIYFLNVSQPLGVSEPLGRGCRESRWAIPLWIAVLGLCGLALFLGSPWLSHLSAILLVGVWAFVARPELSLLRILGICGLLMVSLPPPFGWDKQIVSALQSFSSLACSRLMDLTQIIHVRRGNVIEVISKPLFVEEACSGVDSQYALMAVAGVLLLFGKAGFWVSLLTILTVPIWAILGNLLRIYLIVVGLEWFGVDLSSGTVHTFLGLSVFGFTAWVHWSSVQFLNYLQLVWFSQGESYPEGNRVIEDKHRVRIGFEPMRLAWLALPVSLFVFFPESVRAVIDYHSSPDLPNITLEDSERFPGRGALASNNESQVLNFHTVYRDRNDMLGQHSRIWEVQGDSGRMSVCLDFPFRGWHPLWECYINSGWNRMRSDLIESPDGGFYESVLENDLGDLAILHFSLIDEDGRPYSYQGSVEFRQQASRWSNTLFGRERPGDRIGEPLTFQFQQIAYTSSAPSDEQLDNLRRRFLDHRIQIISGCKDALQTLKQRASHAIE